MRFNCIAPGPIETKVSYTSKHRIIRLSVISPVFRVQVRD